MKEKEEIPKLSDAIDEPEDEKLPPQQHHESVDAHPRPSTEEKEDNPHLVSDSSNVSNGYDDSIIPNTNDDDKITATTPERSSASIQVGDCSSHGGNRIDHDLCLKKKEMAAHGEPTVRNNVVGGIASLDDVRDRHNNDNTNRKQNDQQPPRGATHVAGIDALLARDDRDDHRPVRVEPAYLESSSGLHVLPDGQTMIGSMTFEVEGFVPSVIEPRYLIPEENVQVLDHLYASTEPTSQRNNSRTQQQSPTSMKQYVKKYWLIIIFIIMIFVSVVVASICVTGNCHGPDSPPVITAETTVTYKSFATKEELMNAVDNFTSRKNITTSLEETYGNIAKWDVSQIQDFSYLFALSRNNVNQFFNEDISRWDVSAATNMSHMFEHATTFFGDLSKWNVSRVTDMSWFMAEVTHFNSNLSQWDTSRLENAYGMFYWSNSFEGIGLERWNVSKVYDMSGMFQSCNSFHGDVSKWDVSNVRSMYSMFHYAYRFDGDLSSWDVSNVKDTSQMFWGAADAVNQENQLFYSASSFRGVGLENWKTSNIEKMNSMFYSAKLFDGNLSSWDVSNVYDTSWMFYDASSFRGVGLENWDTSKIETTRAMFYSASSFDGNLSSWNVSNVYDTTDMFSRASSFRGVGLENWDTGKAETIAAMFLLATSFDCNLSSWNLSNVNDTNWMFYNASSFKGVGLENWDTSKSETMKGMFHYATLFDANLSSWDVSKVLDMTSMFHEAISFHGDGLDFWNMSQVTDAAYIFDSAISFNADLSRWDISHIENATDMFTNATSFGGVSWWDNTTDTFTSKDV